MNRQSIFENESRTRKIYIGLWALGAALLGLATGFGRPLLGTGAYTASIILALGVQHKYPGTMFDERDTEIHNKASGHTLAIFGYLSAAIFPALTALNGLGHFKWSAWTSAVALITAAIYLVYGTLSFALED